MPENDGELKEKANDMNVICLEDEAFYALIEKVIIRIKEQNSIREDKWISNEEAMQRCI
jgi:hypothetical protein